MNATTIEKIFAPKNETELKILNTIAEEARWIDIKPYSHNIVGLKLNMLRENHNYDEKQISLVVVAFGLDKKGWGYLIREEWENNPTAETKEAEEELPEEWSAKDWREQKMLSKLKVLRKELETYVKLANTNPREMFERTFTHLNTYTLDPKEVGQKEADAISNWWNTSETALSIKQWFLTNKHKVNGKFGNWSAGFLGSRWADCEINGRRCRFAFTSRKYNPEAFPPEMEAYTGKVYNYSLMIDPTL